MKETEDSMSSINTGAEFSTSCKIIDIVVNESVDITS